MKNLPELWISSPNLKIHISLFFTYNALDIKILNISYALLTFVKLQIMSTTNLYIFANKSKIAYFGYSTSQDGSRFMTLG